MKQVLRSGSPLTPATHGLRVAASFNKAVLPMFRANREGVIINISSVGGKMTFPLGTLYHGTKFAVEGLSEALSFEMAAIGVKVKIVEPGAVKTDFDTRSLDFSNDESIVQYQEIAGKLFAGFAPIFAKGLGTDHGCRSDLAGGDRRHEPTALHGVAIATGRLWNAFHNLESSRSPLPRV